MKSEDRQFFNQFIEVIAILVLVAIGIYWLATSIGSTVEDKVDQRVIERAGTQLVPEAMVVTANIQVQSAAEEETGPRTGAQVYEEIGCGGCHAPNNSLGAPVTTAEWQARVGLGMVTLVSSVQNGKGAMPAMGSEASAEEFADTVRYMLDEAGVPVPGE